MSTITGVASPPSITGVAPMATARVTHGPEPPATTPAATKGISKEGDLMQKLQRLLDTNPATFERMMSKLAVELKTAARKSEGPNAAFLTKLGDTFALAGEAKSLSPLRPAQTPSSPSTSLGSYSQSGHRASAGILKAFVSKAAAEVQMLLSPDEKPPMPPAPVQ